jgi:hypothetical protein
VLHRSLFDVLDLVEDADPLWGTVVGSLCALEARSRWNICIRDRVESGYFEWGNDEIAKGGRDREIRGFIYHCSIA